MAGSCPGTQLVLGPVSDFHPLYGDKTIDLCNAADPVCSDSVDPFTWANNWPDHLTNAYIKSGLISRAADFVAGRL